MFLLTSCGTKCPQEVSRVTRTGEISVLTDVNDSENCIVIQDESYDSESTKDWWGPCKPQEYDFEISFSKHLLVADYGVNKVNVYRANYADTPQQWEDEDWGSRGVVHVLFWCSGRPLVSAVTTIAGENVASGYQVLDKEKILDNLQSVRTVYLKEIDGHSNVVENIGIDSESELLCWDYNLYDFPWTSPDLGESFQFSPDRKSICYIPLSTQYIDQLPIRGGSSGTAGATFEWPDVMPSSRLSSFVPGLNMGGIHVSPDLMYVFDYSEKMFKYTITDTVMCDLDIVDPKNCLPEIKKALKYCAEIPMFLRPSADKSQEALLHIWETNVEVYCMELAYAVMDPCPEENSEDQHLETHELTIVPVWVAYCTATDSRTANPDIVTEGTVLINAVTGESMYSETNGWGENSYLFPHANDP